MPSSAMESRQIETALLPNGIRVVTEHMPHVRSVSVGIWISSGSRSEQRAENGISHFLEHMLFKGTTSRTAEQIAREVDSIGGHLDAFTAKELVSYNTKVLDEHLPVAFDVLADLVLNPVFREEDIEKEKGVILEELKMESDNPEYVVHETFISRFWKGHPLGKPIIGTPRTIRSFDRSMLVDYHRRVYQPANVFITAAGHLDHQDLFRLAESRFGGLAVGKPVGPGGNPAPNAAITYKRKRLQQVHLCIGAPSCPVADDRRYASYVLNTVLGGGMSSRLFQNIRERQGLAYAVFSELNLFRDTGCLAVYAGTSKENASKLVASVLEEFRRLKNEPVPAEELRRAKDHLKGSLMLSLESTSSRMANLARQEIYFSRYFSLDELIESIEQVTVDEVQAIAAASFRGEEIALTVLGSPEGPELTRENLIC
ncbi:MAG: pitrilysin family protein [Bryobacteraceae bacterium]|nr:pitrilysin family protein [Bryobacteraceae bacterium]